MMGVEVARIREAMRRRAEAKKYRSEILKIAAACARFQHLDVADLTQDDLKQFGEYANTLKDIYYRL